MTYAAILNESARLAFFLAAAIVLLFGLAKWLSWESDEAIPESDLIDPDSPVDAQGRRRIGEPPCGVTPLRPIDDEPWMGEGRREWR